jgi:hypothetical protein
MGHKNLHNPATPTYKTIPNRIDVGFVPATEPWPYTTD